MSKKLISLIAILIAFSAFLSGGVAAKFLGSKTGEVSALANYTVPPNSNVEDLYWANEILNSDREFVLWFRHGEREKWTGTVTVFDYFDITKGDSYPKAWRPAVCLTSKGISESQVVGATFRELGIIPSKIITSPSCRAKETATEAFGGYDEEWREVLHATAVSAKQQETFAESLRERISTVVQSSANKSGPVVVTGHGNTLPYYSSTLFVTSKVKNWDVSELGFVVIEITPDGLVAQHSFVEFYTFASALLEYKD